MVKLDVERLRFEVVKLDVERLRFEVGRQNSDQQCLSKLLQYFNDYNKIQLLSSFRFGAAHSHN